MTSQTLNGKIREKKLWQKARILDEDPEIGNIKGCEIWVLPNIKEPAIGNNAVNGKPIHITVGTKYIKTNLHVNNSPVYRRLDTLELLPEFCEMPPTYTMAYLFEYAKKMDS